LPQGKSVFRGHLKGIGVSEGIAIAKVWLLKSPWDEVVSQTIAKNKIQNELKRYKQAVDDVAQQLVVCRDRVKREIGRDEARIFEAHLSILNDPFFQEEVPALIVRLRRNSECILKKGLDRLKKKFLKMDNDFFRHRIDDIQDVAGRLLRVLLRTEINPLLFKHPVVMVARNLTPSDTAHIDRDKVLGFATELGGETSHASILARSMGLAAVVGVERLMQEANEGDTIILDALSGTVYIDPPHDLLKEYQKRLGDFKTYQSRLAEEIDLPSETVDRVSVSLQANISMIADLSLAQKYKSEGIGLFRTELPFLVAEKLLSEEEQFQIYRNVVETMQNRSVTIRTLDIGGDKFLPFQGVQGELNPFLGWRSIRIFLQEKDVFKTQLRAILRASHFGKVRILFPMISSLEEIEQINALMEESREELQHGGIPFDASIECGIMIEVPSAAILANRLIQYTDFFSIGTNDLIQYTLAVDRNNEKVARFYQPLNPAILYLINSTIQAAARAKKPISLCGEMAGNPMYVPMLLGFGLRTFSMSPIMLPEVKERIRVVTLKECEALSRTVLGMDSAEEILSVILDFHHEANKRQNVPFPAPTQPSKKT